MLEQFVEPIKLWAEGVIHSVGVPGIVGLNLLSSANIPIPSEVILPFGGMMSGEGAFNVHVVAWAGIVGSTVGSCISYAFGAFLGKDFLLKYGKYVLLRPKEIQHAEEWFERYGLNVTLWGRFVPLVRSFISLPAGFFKADFRKFTLYAFLAALPWCYAWTYAGFLLGRNWKSIEGWFKYLDMAVVLGLAIILGRFLYYRLGKASQDPASS